MNSKKTILTLGVALCALSLQAQNVGIGTDTPKAALDITNSNSGLLIPRMTTSVRNALTVGADQNGMQVYDTGTQSIWYYDHTTTSWKEISAGSGDNLGDHTATQNVILDSNWISNDGDNEGIYIDNDGKVGVGTNAPAVPFEVVGEGDFRTIYVSDSSSVASTVSQQGTAVIDDGDWAADNGNSRWYLAKLSDNTTVRSGTNQVAITDAGNLGVGTNAPADKLHVVGDARITGAIKDAAGNTGTAGQVLSSTVTGTAWTNAGAPNTDNQDISATLTGTDLDITLTGDTVAANNTTIDLSGFTPDNMGNHTATQDVVFGTNAISDENTETGTDGQLLSRTATGMDWIDAPTSDILADTDADTKIEVEANSDEDRIRFSTDGTERMVVDQTGKVGIGTVNPLVDFEVSGNNPQFVVRQTASNLQAPLILGMHDGASSPPLDNTNLATFGGGSTGGQGAAGMRVTTSEAWSNSGNGTELSFYTTPNNGNLNMKQMTLSNSGNLGIGTTTPSVPLDVAGEGDFRTIYVSDNTSAASTISQQGTAVIDDGDFAADNANSRWYLAKLSDNSTTRSGTNQVVITDAGNLGLGTATPDDQLEVTGSAQFAGELKDASGSAGASGDVLSSTASGTAWIGLGSFNTDAQDIAASLTGTDLDITLTGDANAANNATIDLSSVNTDAQDIAATLTGSNLYITLTGDANAANNATIDLSGVNTDAQDIAATLTGSNLDITLTGDANAANNATIDLSGVNTDAQDIAAALTGTDLNITLTGDANAANNATIDLSGFTPDDMGNHTASQDVDLGTNKLVGNGGTAGIEVSATGIVGVGVTGTLNPNATMEVNGDVYAAGVLLTSDARYKTNVEELTDALDIVLQLRGVRHDWKQGFRGKVFPEGTVLGLIAQEVEVYLPEIVRTDANGYKSVDYTKLTPLLIEAMQTQQEQINAQEQRLIRIEEHMGIR